MIVHSYYDEDPRVRRQAETLVAGGGTVHVLGLRRHEDEAETIVEGVRLHRLNVQRHQGSGISTYLREYLTFLLRSAWFAVKAHRRERFGLVQVHSLPDFLVFAALPLRLVGVPIVLDLHEAMPEFFAMRFAAAANPVTHRLLLMQEHASIAAATATLTVNEAVADRLRGLGVPADKVTVVRNSPALARFDPSAWPDRPFACDGIVRVVYAGALTPIYELDVLLRAISMVTSLRPRLGIHLDIYGRGDSEPDLRSLVAELGLGDSVAFHGRIPIEDVPAAIAAADIGVAPTRLDRYTRLTLSTKLFEYAAMRKPVVASRLPMVERTFGAGSAAMYEPGDPGSLADTILQLVDDPDRRGRAVELAAQVVHANSWEREADRYVAMIDGLALDTP